MLQTNKKLKEKKKNPPKKKNFLPCNFLDFWRKSWFLRDPISKRGFLFWTTDMSVWKKKTDWRKKKNKNRSRRKQNAGKITGIIFRPTYIFWQNCTFFFFFLPTYQWVRAKKPLLSLGPSKAKIFSKNPKIWKAKKIFFLRKKKFFFLVFCLFGTWTNFLWGQNFLRHDYKGWIFYILT